MIFIWVVAFVRNFFECSRIWSLNRKAPKSAVRGSIAAPSCFALSIRRFTPHRSRENAITLSLATPVFLG